MWWFDRAAVEVGLKLRDKFQVCQFIESGTYRGVNLKFWSYRFYHVIGVELHRRYFHETDRRLDNCRNAKIICQDSSQFLKEFVDNYYQVGRQDTVLIYLDAHFYTPGEKRIREDRWVILRELQALAGFENCILAIHDFNCGGGLYGLVYDDEPLNFELVKDYLVQVNPNFSYYTNLREHCNPHTEESIIGVEGLESDFTTLETIRFHNTDRLKYRGILYCTPTPLDLTQFKLRKIIE